MAVRGRVQGVGFRPFVYRLADEMGLGGLVGNDARGAFIEVEGLPAALDRFVERLRAELPPLARIAGMDVQAIAPQGEREFRIDRSKAGRRQEAEITPDVATCEDCLGELRDPADRRYRYPFINCTNCGPRYSIVRAVPYDRPNTTMSRFAMCPACQAEYDDPRDRRFHAQPNACPACGPRAWLADVEGRELDEDWLSGCVRRLEAGQIVAIKGLGGVHLACRADDDGAVGRLRRRKSREAKPLAIMVPSLAAACELAAIDDAVAGALTDASRPIVLAAKRPDAPISGAVAPASACYGLLLPYTPMHALLLGQIGRPLVMTSGNPSDEPLCRDNAEAVRRLGAIADAFVLHDRDIERRVDDSVVIAVRWPGQDGGPSWRTVPLRRARGFVPAPIRLTAASPEPILAVGGQLKSAVCVVRGDQAVLSEHLGELHHPATLRNFVETIERFKTLLRTEPTVVACDLHPDYAATRHARGLGLRTLGVQHHHAHVAACMADNGIAGEVIGVSCDGTGYGLDGAVWGCEVLVGAAAAFTRAAHLRNVPLPGGDAAAIETWRPAAALAADALGERWRALPAFARVEAAALDVAAARLARPGRLVRTSSLGRLFNAAAFLLGVCDRNRYEAEAPMRLEALAARGGPAEPLDFAVGGGEDADAAMELDVRPLIVGLVDGAAAGRAVETLAAAFHETLAAMLAEAVGRVARRTGLRRVVLSGGCFANRLLLGGLARRVRAAGLEVLAHRQVPTGDGGIALGQAVVAAARLARGVT